MKFEILIWKTFMICYYPNMVLFICHLKKCSEIIFGHSPYANFHVTQFCVGVYLNNLTLKFIWDTWQKLSKTEKKKLFWI